MAAGRSGAACIFNAPQIRNTAAAAAVKVRQTAARSGFYICLRVEINDFVFFLFKGEPRLKVNAASCGAGIGWNES